MTLASPWLPRRAAITPDRPAVVIRDTTFTFADLEFRSRELAGSLASRGLCPGDVAAALLENGLPMVELLHAVDRCGATLLPLNIRLSARELSYQMGDSGAHLLLHDDDGLAEIAIEAGALAPGIETVSIRSLGTQTDATTTDAGPIDQDRPLAILYTSGTTGKPKGACLTRANFLWSAVSSGWQLGLHPDDRWLACLPLFHVGGISMLVRSTLYGCPVVIHERFDPEAVIQELTTQHITHISLTATMLQRILDALGPDHAPRWLRCVLLGGGPCPPLLLADARSRGFPIALTYGLTEAASQVATRPPFSDEKPSGALTPLFGTELRIVDGSGREVPNGIDGEICVRGPTVMSGYVQTQGTSDTTLRDGWLHTGDIGVLDDAGRLLVHDRRSDLIVSGGENIYPAEVEAILLEHPEIAEVGVSSREDAEYGRRPVAWWVLRGGAVAPHTSTLQSFCRERLAGYKVPIAFFRVDALPRNAAGKLLRDQLASTPRTDPPTPD